MSPTNNNNDYVMSIDELNIASKSSGQGLAKNKKQVS